MSLKILLGLESFDITEEEIMQKINDANHLQLREVEFASLNKKVKVKISSVNPAGITKGYWNYYEVK
jgi:hypothetical protein